MSQRDSIPVSRKRKRRRRLNPAPICLALLLILGGLVFFAWQLHGGTALDGFLRMQDVSIGGISLEGLTKKEAKALLAPIGAAATTQPLVIRILEDTVTFTPQELSVSADTDRAVDEAFVNRAQAEVDLLPYLGLERERISRLVHTLGERYNRELSQTTCAITGVRPELTQAPWEGEPEQVLTVTLGRPEVGLDTDDLYERILRGYLTGELEITAQYRLLEPEAPDLEQLWAHSYIHPVDAVLEESTYTVTPEVWGYGFDLEAARALIREAEPGQTVTVPFSRIPPAQTAETVGGHLFRDLLAEAKTPYKGADTNNRNTNLAIACAAIDGLVLLPGEVFSYNDTLGQRTAEKGYKPAPSYEGGLTVDTLGGGICQISSTLYYCTLLADLETVRRYNHGYVSDYIDPGMDATVTWGGADFKFRNDTNWPIRIRAWREEGYVNVQIYGTDEKDYYVKMDYKVLSTTSYETVYRELTADNPEGYQDGDVIVTPYRGMEARAYKEKYSKTTHELISRESESLNVYKKRDKVVCKIVETTQPTQTPETEG